MSSKCTPLLGGAVPTLKMLIVQWDELSRLVPWCAPFISAGLRCAKKYYQHMGEICAYIIAMCRLIWFNWNIAQFDICSCKPNYLVHVDHAILDWWGEGFGTQGSCGHGLSFPVTAWGLILILYRWRIIRSGCLKHAQLPHPPTRWWPILFTHIMLQSPNYECHTKGQWSANCWTRTGYISHNWGCNRYWSIGILECK